MMQNTHASTATTVFLVLSQANLPPNWLQTYSPRILNAPRRADVELPTPMPDAALVSHSNDPAILSGHCEYTPHIELSKLTPIYMEVYSTIYTAKRSVHNYRSFVETTEARLKKWREQWPAAYKDPSRGTDIDKNEGCNHVTGSVCKTHMCWVCLETFPRGEGVYEHMRRAHGGIGI